ncbi:MAG: hypothetical protein N7Q72_07630, partial [Spiroplasma sp. Tabriz.8]|nr:hypothetical protein [Spiroplasma sp. Tabriz.8]
MYRCGRYRVHLQRCNGNNNNNNNNNNNTKMWLFSVRAAADKARGVYPGTPPPSRFPLTASR